jgi:hypothetical protein
VCGVVVVPATIHVLLVESGVLPDPLGAAARGYTLTGYALGFVVVVVGTLSFAYALRKRGLQESLLGKGSMMSWLWMHVSLGAMALALSVLHAGCGVVSYSLSSGKVLFYAFLALTFSGMLWRVVYRFVPARAAKIVGNYSREGMADRIEQLTTEIEKAAAGKSDTLRGLSQWVSDAERSDAELAYYAQQLSAEEQRALGEIKVLADSRRRAAERMRHQRKYTRWQQIWRVVHVPLALTIPILLVVHIIGATRLVTRLTPIASPPGAAFSALSPSKACKSCHRAAYDQWKDSMHAHGMRSPVMIAQANQVLRAYLDDEDAPDPRLLCVNCHGPVGILMTEQKQAFLPLERDGFDADFLNEGVGCVVCHQFTGNDPARGDAGLTSFQQKYDDVGHTYYGPIGDPVGNAFHKSERGEIFDDPTRLCVHCHNVVYDRNGDGKIEKGIDLILQETTKEYDEYRQNGGSGACLDCHMPVDEDRDRAAESADLYFEQDRKAPKRKVRDHSFVAVDYPLDVAPEDDPQRAKRGRLLRSAATLDAVAIGNTLTVTIKNTGTGHNLPTGLAFARQMWLEVIAVDGAGNRRFESGVLRKNTDDLCDAATMEDRALAKFVRGCDRSDPFLVNYQLKLVDEIEVKQDARGSPVFDEDGERVVVAADDAKETVIQRIEGGAVARKRPSDNKLLAPIEPNEERVHRYVLPFGSQKVTVRLLFRSFGPYFLRGLADQQPAKERPQLAPLIKNLQVDEMATQVVNLRF